MDYPSANPLPAVAQTVVGYIATLLGGWMLRHGYITADDTQIIGGALLAAASLGWGVYKTFKHKGEVKTAAALPAADIK